jgi:hypothetical protein
LANDSNRNNTTELFHENKLVETIKKTNKSMLESIAEEQELDNRELSSLEGGDRNDKIAESSVNRYADIY